MERDQLDISSPSTWIPSGVCEATEELVAAAAATGLPAGGDTRKLLPHFLHLIRAPISSARSCLFHRRSDT